MASTPAVSMFSLSLLSLSPKSNLSSTIVSLKPSDSLSSFKSQTLISLATRLRLTRNNRRSTVVFANVDAPEAERKLYIGNIPRTVDNEELTLIVREHGAVEKAQVMYDKYSGRSRRFAFVTMKTVDDATAATEKLNGTQIGGREIKVNITEKPITTVDVDLSLLQAEESEFVDSPHKVYVGNLAKTITTQSLKQFFSGSANVLSAKASRVPGTSKSSGYGFVTFSSDEDVQAAISAFNNALLEGQRIRVNKA